MAVVIFQCMAATIFRDETIKMLILNCFRFVLNMTMLDLTLIGCVITWLCVIPRQASHGRLRVVNGLAARKRISCTENCWFEVRIKQTYLLYMQGSFVA